MLWFLSLAAAAGYTVDRYEDDAVATLGRVAPQRQAITEVVLRPRATFGGDHAPDAAEIAALHEAAHDRCFLARSVTCTLRIEPRD
jgi:organic hydroperoxide reductase OsmC/OhrA